MDDEEWPLPEDASGALAANDPTLIEWAAARLGTPGSGLRLTPLPGATSSHLYRAEDARGTTLAVLRLFSNAAWLAREPDLPEHEAAALERLARTSFPTPQPLGVRRLPHLPPALLMSALPGRVDLPAAAAVTWLDRLAGTLAEIHDTPAGNFPWRYVSWTRDGQLMVPEWSGRRVLWRDAIDAFRAGPPSWPGEFLHRDYHPTNVLWRDGRISGVVDWVNACRGPAGIDVAHCRLNLALMYGISAPRRFLDAYAEARPGYRHEGYWDLEVVLGALPDPHDYRPWLEFGLPAIGVEARRARLEALLEDAFGLL